MTEAVYEAGTEKSDSLRSSMKVGNIAPSLRAVEAFERVPAYYYYDNALLLPW